MTEDSRFFENVAMYLRKSRAEEGEDTDVVLARHKAQLSKFAAARGINVTKIYEEVVSGDSLFTRPRMLELLRDVEDGRYTGILCTDIDRLGRGNMKEQGLILETLKDNGTAIITPDKIYDLNNELDETQSEFKTFMARQELKIIKKRLSRGIRHTLERGGYVSNVPFGYVRTYKDKLPTLAPHPQEAQIVRLIFNLYINGDGCQTICNKLAAMGIKPHRGNNFSRNSIRKILTNPVYIGKVVWGQKKHIRPRKFGDKHRVVYVPQSDWLIFDGLHPAIVDKETFYKAKSMLEKRSHPPYRKGECLSNPLAGILVCRRCGRTMTKRTFGDGENKYDYILCPTPGCMKASRADYVEQAILRVLQIKLQGLEIGKDFETDNAKQAQNNEILEKMRAELSKLYNQRDRLYDLLEQGVYSTEIFTAREKSLSERIDSIKNEIAAAEKELQTKRGRETIPAAKINNVLQEYWKGTPQEKNQLLKTVISRAYYYKAKTASPKEFVIEIELRDFNA